MRLLFVASVALIATATSATIRPQTTVPGECPTNSQWYVCTTNNFHGCCTIDPCNLTAGCPSPSTPPSDTNPPSTSLAPPTSTAAPLPPPPNPAKCSKKLFNPAIYPLFPSQPSLAGISSPTTPFNVTRTASGDEQQQLLVFTNIPKVAVAAAGNCTLHWGVAALGAGRSVFKVFGNGLVSVDYLPPFPAGSIGDYSYGSVERLVEAGGQRSGADFTGWPEVVGEQNWHPTGTWECRREMAFRVAIDSVGTSMEHGVGAVLMEHGEGNGWFVEHDVDC